VAYVVAHFADLSPVSVQRFLAPSSEPPEGVEQGRKAEGELVRAFAVLSTLDREGGTHGRAASSEETPPQQEAEAVLPETDSTASFPSFGLQGLEISTEEERCGRDGR
jgi:hypothetical protein